MDIGWTSTTAWEKGLVCKRSEFIVYLTRFSSIPFFPMVGRLSGSSTCGIDCQHWISHCIIAYWSIPIMWQKTICSTLVHTLRSWFHQGLIIKDVRVLHEWHVSHFYDQQEITNSILGKGQYWSVRNRDKSTLLSVKK